ncbi:hypothetical protein Q3G72_025592 [Acer saccharum]|nr:hypothetical protein Q3G72_025592 [Acer saccharum]
MNMKELESKDLGDSVIPTIEVINEKEVDNMSNGEQKVKLEVVLIRQGIFCVPDKYILKRWRKDVKICHSKVKISYDNWDVKPEGQRFDKMCNSFYEVADLATNNETKFCMVMEAIECLKAKLTLDASGGGSGQCGANLIEDIIGNGELNSNILTPRVVRSKGRPPYKRRQSKVEQIIRKKKRKTKGDEVSKRQQLFKGLSVLSVVVARSGYVLLFVSDLGVLSVVARFRFCLCLGVCSVWS